MATFKNLFKSRFSKHIRSELYSPLLNPKVLTNSVVQYYFSIRTGSEYTSPLWTTSYGQRFQMLESSRVESGSILLIK